MHYNGNPVRPKPLLIEPGWSIDQLTTVVECDSARDTLVSAIIKTEEALNAQGANEAAGSMSTSAGPVGPKRRCA
jgi:hypothetical protein